jgi:hypothetical protein
MAVCTLFGFCVIRFAIQTIVIVVAAAHRDRGRGSGEEQIEHRLVDAEVEPADLDRDPGVELELVLGLVHAVLARAAESGRQDDGYQDDHAESEGDLLAPAEVRERLHRDGPFVS